MTEFIIPLLPVLFRLSIIGLILQNSDPKKKAGRVSENFNIPIPASYGPFLMKRIFKKEAVPFFAERI